MKRKSRTVLCLIIILVSLIFCGGLTGFIITVWLRPVLVSAAAGLNLPKDLLDIIKEVEKIEKQITKLNRATIHKLGELEREVARQDRQKVARHYRQYLEAEMELNEVVIWYCLGAAAVMRRAELEMNKNRLTEAQVQQLIHWCWQRQFFLEELTRPNPNEILGEAYDLLFPGEPVNPNRTRHDLVSFFV